MGGGVVHRRGGVANQIGKFERENPRTLWKSRQPYAHCFMQGCVGNASLILIDERTAGMATTARALK